VRKDVIISVKGKPQGPDGDVEAVELTTFGRYYRVGDTYYIAYRESELTGMPGVVTVLKAQSETVSMIRRGRMKAEMVFELHQKHYGRYETEAGPFMTAVATMGIRNRLRDSGGDLAIHYGLELNYTQVADNLLRVHVEPAPPTLKTKENN